MHQLNPKHQPAPIALGQFLDMTGLTFMDKIHPRRRSTIGPGEMLGIHRNQGDSTTRSMAGREYQTIEYANYVLSFPYLAIYQWVRPGAFIESVFLPAR